MTFLTVVATILLLLAVSGLFLLVGFGLWRLVRIGSESSAFLAGASFFSGAVLYITSFGIYESLLGSAYKAVVLTLVTLLIVTVFLWKRSFLSTRYLKVFVVGVGIFLLWLVLNTIHAMQPLSSVVLNPETTHPSLGFIAAEHSFRLENIIVTMGKADALPYINQNSGQAILAFIPTVFGIDLPQFSIVVWHTIVVFFSLLLVYGCARYFVSAKAALVPTAFVVLGNTAISYQYISITDSGHALMLARNYEVIIGLASLLLLTIVIRNAFLKKFKVVSVWYLFITTFAWSVVGGHYLLIVLALTALMFGYHYSQVRLKTFVSTVLILITGCALGTLLMGGLFAFNAPVSDIPGVKSVNEGSSESPLSLRAFRTVEAEYHTRLKLFYLTDRFMGVDDGVGDVGVKNLENIEADSTPVSESATETESLVNFNTQLNSLVSDLKTNPVLWDLIRLVRSFQLVALPLLGVFIGYWFIYRRPQAFVPVVRELYFFTVPLFLGGWIIASVFLVYGQYGETSRFFAPGISAGMFLLGLVVLKLFKQESLKFRTTAFGIMFIVLVPVIFDYIVVGLVGNFILPTTQSLIYDAAQEGEFVALDDVLPMQERLDILFSPGTIRGNGL